MSGFNDSMAAVGIATGNPGLGMALRNDYRRRASSSGEYNRRQQEENERQHKRRQHEENARQQAALSFKKHFDKALQLLESSSFDDAINELNNSLRYKETAEVILNLARCYIGKNNFYKAFELLKSMESIGANMPGYNDEKSKCESELLILTRRDFEKAKNLYGEGEFANAQESIDAAIQNCFDLDVKLLGELNLLKKQIKWENYRQDVHEQLLLANQHLINNDFQMAMISLNSCLQYYSEYKDQLNSIESTHADTAKQLLEQAKRLQEHAENIAFQTEANEDLVIFKQKFSEFDINGAIAQLYLIQKSTKRITNPEDVKELNYIPPEVLQNSIDSLRKWYADYLRRQENSPVIISQRIMLAITIAKPMTAKCYDAVQELIQRVLQDQWQHLELANEVELIDKIQQIVSALLIKTYFSSICINRYYITRENLDRIQPALNDFIEKLNPITSAAINLPILEFMPIHESNTPKNSLAP